VVPATETFTEKLDHVTELIMAALPHRASVETQEIPRYLL
jgi:hypothetical protein